MFQSFFEEFLSAGTQYLHLREFANYMVVHAGDGGLVLQAFSLALTEFLQFYQNTILNVDADVQARREKERALLQNEGGMHRETTLLELKVQLGSLMQQLKLVSSAC